MLTDLIPLAIASAVVPIQIVVTVLLMRASRATAAAWVAGMTTTRLAQGVLLGVVLEVAVGGDGGPGPLASTLLLAFAALLLAGAAREAMGAEDPDAPPPKWMAKVESMTPGKAFGLGAGYLAIAPKFWVFTIGALGVIAEAPLAPLAAAGVYVGFVAAAQIGSLLVLLAGFAAPRRSADALDALAAWLQRHNRAITIALGLIFGLWFLVKALQGFGIL
jgi:hypothetical protein